MGESVRVCAFEELVDRQPRPVVIDGHRIALVRVGDEIFAVNDICSHAEVSLSEGTVAADATISCWLHGSRFDLRTGEPDEPPAWEPIQTHKTELIEDEGIPMVAVSLSPREEMTA